MAETVSVEELADVIAEYLKEYNEDVNEVVREEVEAVALEALNDLKSNPDIPARSKKYRKSFKIKVHHGAEGSYHSSVYSKEPHYRLTHLLNNGHRIVLKGNIDTGKKTKAYPHWDRAQKIVDTLDERVKRRLGE